MKWPDFPLPSGVEPIPGEPLRMRVQSRTDPKLKQELRDGKPRRMRRCCHILKAMEFFAEAHARILARHLNKKAA